MLQCEPAPLLRLRCAAPPGLLFDRNVSEETGRADHRTSSESGTDTGAVSQGGRRLGGVYQPSRTRGQFPERRLVGRSCQDIESAGCRPVHFSEPEAEAHAAAARQHAGIVSTPHKLLKRDFRLLFSK